MLCTYGTIEDEQYIFAADDGLLPSLKRVSLSDI
jgi:hypothetical protein